MKTYGGVETEVHIFITSALDGGEWPPSHSGRFTPVDEEIITKNSKNTNPFIGI
jgi:hypothetical protein